MRNRSTLLSHLYSNVEKIAWTKRFCAEFANSVISDIEEMTVRKKGEGGVKSCLSVYDRMIILEFFFPTPANPPTINATFILFLIPFIPLH